MGLNAFTVRFPAETVAGTDKNRNRTGKTRLDRYRPLGHRGESSGMRSTPANRAARHDQTGHDRTYGAIPA